MQLIHDADTCETGMYQLVTTCLARMSKTLGLIAALGEPKAAHVPVLTKEEWVRSGVQSQS